MKKVSKEDLKIISASFLIVTLVFGFGYAQYASGEAVSLTLTVATSLTFSTKTDNFGSITVTTINYATTTLSATTNNVSGWNVTLYGDQQATASTTCYLNSSSGSGITDQAEWYAGAATTTAGKNAVRISSLDSSQQVLAFRVMSASGSVPFRASTWWGTGDNYADNVNTLFAGVPSSTVQQQVGNAGAGSYSASTHLNTVWYYLQVAATQQSGAYTCPLTYTATGN